MKYCKWTYNYIDDTHNTSCGKVDGWGSKNDVEEDGFIYCPYCGRIIKHFAKFSDSGKVEPDLPLLRKEDKGD